MALILRIKTLLALLLLIPSLSWGKIIDPNMKGGVCKINEKWNDWYDKNQKVWNSHF